VITIGQSMQLIISNIQFLFQSINFCEDFLQYTIIFVCSLKNQYNRQDVYASGKSVNFSNHNRNNAFLWQQNI